MKRYYLSLVAVVAVFAGVGFSQPTETQAGYVGIKQNNVQIAINIAVYCPGTSQNITQTAINVAIVDDPLLSANKVNARQTNVQIAYNVALGSAGASQAIDQYAGNTGIVVLGAANDIKEVQKNFGNDVNIAVSSPGNAQSIAQAAQNSLSVNDVNSPTILAALTTVVNQSNFAFTLQTCAPEGVSKQVELWGAYMFGGLTPYEMYKQAQQQP